MTTLIERATQVVKQDREKLASRYLAILEMGDKAKPKELTELAELIQQLDLATEDAKRHESMIQERVDLQKLVDEIPHRDTAVEKGKTVKAEQIAKADADLELAKEKHKQTRIKAMQDFDKLTRAKVQAHSAQDRLRRIAWEFESVKTGKPVAAVQRERTAR